MTNTNTIVVPARTLTIAEAVPSKAMSLIESAAIASIIRPVNNRIDPGVSNVDAVFRVTATVTKNPDETEVKSLGVDWTTLALLLANHVNGSTLTHCLSEMAQHHRMGTKPNTNVKDWVVAEWEQFGLTTSGNRSGKTLVTGRIERV